MKFKINDKYQSIISQYLHQHQNQQQPTWIWTQQQDSEIGILEMKVSENMMIKYEEIVGEKLLNQFNKQKMNKKDILIDNWMSQYAKMLQNMKGVDDKWQNLNYMLLLNDYNYLKQRIVSKKELLKQKIRQNQIEREKFIQQSEYQERKIALSLENLQFRVKMIESNKQQQNQELVRVKNVIKNGLWGLLPQIEQKLERIQILQRQINSIKNKNDNDI